MNLLNIALTGNFTHVDGFGFMRDTNQGELQVGTSNRKKDEHNNALTYHFVGI